MPKKRRKAAFDATLRFRAFKTLEDRIERIVAARGYGDSADFMREGFTKLVMQEEARLGLPPLPETPPLKRVKYSGKTKRKKR